MQTQPPKHHPVGVAIAGLGFGEAVHLPALKVNPELKPVALWHPRQNRLDQACESHGLKGYTDWDALLQDPAVDAVIITTPPEPRHDLARRALQAGKHLLLEKPVALNADQVADLQRLAIQEGLSVAIDFEYRAVPLFMQAARLLQEGAIGTPWLVKYDWLMSSRANPDRPWSWYSDAAQGGGVIGALGTHAFDTLHWLIGPTTDLRALHHTAIEQRPDGEGRLTRVDAEDIALIQARLALADGLGSVPAQISLASVARNGRGCWLEIYGSKGSLTLGSDNQKDYVHGFSLCISKAGEAARVVQVDPDLSFPTTWSDGRIAPVARLQGWWADSIRSGRPMVPGLAEGLLSQTACDQAQASHRAWSASV
ncbi:MAG: Gfo/Idh/MocA family oxidoreductase [Synechococcus sp.]|nr:Gfo/Idh/MocA family oxidoreductase [Synechococcus sp.]